MRKNKFKENVEKYKKVVDLETKKEEIRKYFLESETLLAQGIERELNRLGMLAGDYRVANMIILIKRYRSAEFGFSYREAVTATMWPTAAMWGCHDKNKVEESIERLIELRPSTMKKVIRELKQDKPGVIHRFISGLWSSK